MAEAPDTESSQSFVQATVSIAALSTVTIRSGDTVVATYRPRRAPRTSSSRAAAIKAGESYDVYVGDTKAATVTAGTATAGGMGGGMGRH